MILSLIPLSACRSRTAAQSGIVRTSAFVLLAFLSTAAHAGEERTAVAYNKNEHSLQKKTRTVKPIVTEKTEYYYISGLSEKELRLQMCEKGCGWEDGKKYDSVTSWRIKWNYDRERTPDACSARDFQPTIEILYRYPNWDRPDGAPRQLVEKWDAYFQNLVAHETGHRDIVVAASERMIREIHALPPAATCEDLDLQVRNVSRSHIKELRAEEREYDESTCHGVRQGAVFP